ncbi:MAG: GNAT family N-acetyltransferase [Pseudomonadales bacterium]|nr:GNAT family N-acetyltransferase [Pseudomonadales bacterium]
MSLTTDGHTTIRAPLPGDAATLIAGRDTQFNLFMGEGSADPQPSACIIADGQVVGWTDYDPDLNCLESGEVNIGYNLFPTYRGKGHASRAVQLLIHHLALDGMHDTAVFLIRKDNKASLALAERLGFEHTGGEGENIRFKKSLPSLTYTDGIVTIRRRQLTDLDEDLTAKDNEQ